MANNKSTKRALFSSVVALLLCFTMLLGTTFAWFTDSAISAGNVIKTGNLDVDLYLWTGPDDSIEITASSDPIFGKGSAQIAQNNAAETLWEPGKTQTVYLSVKNDGSLALQYKVILEVRSDDEKNIIEVLEYAITPDATYPKEGESHPAWTGNGTKVEEGTNVTTGTDVTLAAGSEHFFALSVHMLETAGNEYQGASVTFDIKVLATQVAFEEDSFGNGYDANATYPNISLPQQIPATGDAQGITLSTSDVKVTAASSLTDAIIANNANVEDADKITAVTLKHAKPVIDETAKTIHFEYIEIVDQNGEIIDISTYDLEEKLEVTIYVGTDFAGNTVTVYHDGVVIAVGDVNQEGYLTYTADHFCAVTVSVVDPIEKNADGKYEIKNLDQLFLFAQLVNAGKNFAGETVVLAADIDLDNMEWTPIGNADNAFKGTFDGQNHVISNLKITNKGQSNVGLFGFTTDGEIKNLTVENATVGGRLNVGVVAGTPYTSKYTNITVTGHVEVDGMAYVGAVGGKNAYANWTDITVDVDSTSYVNANSVENGTAYRTYVGGVVGFNGEGAHTFKNITSNINVSGSTCDVGGAFGIAHYNNKFENVTVTGNVTIYAAAEAAEADEMGGIAGVWHNENGTTVSFTNCKFEGKLTANEAADLTNNTIVGAPYSATGTGILVIDGEEYVGTLAAIQAQLSADKTDIVIKIANTINGDLVITQKPDVKITIDGCGNTFNGVITVDGKSSTYTTAGLTITNVNFKAEEISKDACINLGDGNNATRYTCNVIVDSCTFDVPEAVGVKSYTGGDKDLTITNCTATSNAHSLVQIAGVDGVKIDSCKIYSKNGINVNQSNNVIISNCEADVQGYAVRFGASKGDTAVKEAYKIENCTLKSACAEEEDAVIILRGTADYSTLNIIDTTIEGSTEIANNAIEAWVLFNGYAQVSTADELVAALEAGKDVIFTNDIKIDPAKMSNAYGATGINVKNGQTINGNGYTLDVKGAGGTWDSGINTTGGIIKNITVTGSYRGIFINHNSAHSEKVVLDNVTLTGVTYTISCDQGLYQGIEATDCTFNGWTSFAKTAGEAKFINCSFGEGNGYKYCRPYSNTEFVNCTFAAGYAVDTTRATVTFTDCTFVEAN